MRSRYRDWLRAGRSGDRSPVGARFSAPVQTGPGAHPASCTMGTGSFPGVNSGRGVTLTPHPLLVPWSRKSIDVPLLPLWAVRPVQSLSACTRVHFTFTFDLCAESVIDSYVSVWRYLWATYFWRTCFRKYFAYVTFTIILFCCKLVNCFAAESVPPPTSGDLWRGKYSEVL